MPKIVILLPNGARGGAERVLTALAESLYASGDDCVLIYLSDEKMPGFSFLGQKEVIKGTFIRNMIFVLPSRLGRLGKEDVVISSQFYINVWLGILKWSGLLRAKTVARESTRVFIRFRGWRKWLAGLGVRMFYNRHALIVAQTKVMEQDISALNKGVNVLHLPNPFEPPNQPTEIDLPETWKEVPWVVAAGRLIPIKRFDLLIDAFVPLANKTKLVILGEGPERASLEALVEKADLIDRVLLKGEVQNPNAYFERAACCVVCSELEGFPNVLLEMMYANGAVVSTRCADGISELSGIFTCEPNDREGLAKAMISSMNQSRPKKEEIRRNMQAYLTGRNYHTYWGHLAKAIAFDLTHKSKFERA